MDSVQPSDHDILLRLDESVNGKDIGLKDTVLRLEKKLDSHFETHRKERNAIIAALGTGIASFVGLILRIFTHN